MANIFQRVATKVSGGKEKQLERLGCSMAQAADDRWSDRDELQRLDDMLQTQRNQVQIRMRQLRAGSAPPFDAFAPHSIYESNTPWKDVQLEPSTIPSMISPEEEKYMWWVTSQLRGVGSVVEFGPWCGRSTMRLAQGMCAANRTSQQKLHVYDDFIWRTSWMDGLAQEFGMKPLPNHSSFLDAFRQNLSAFEDLIEPHAVKLAEDSVREQEASEDLAVAALYDTMSPFSWDEGPIECVVADVGRTIAVNESWYHRVRDFLIPNETIVVLQDWGWCKEVPEHWYNQMHWWTQSKRDELRLIHELRNGATAAFLFCGR